MSPARAAGGGVLRKENDFPKRKQGAVIPPAPGKARVTIRLDNAVVDWFRSQVDEAGSGCYQSLMNDALREHIARRRKPLESTIRRVIREELRRTGQGRDRQQDAATQQS